VSDKLQVFYAYTYGTAGWLALQAAPLILSPTIMVTLLSPEIREPTGYSHGLKLYDTADRE
jgi:hypothetical protein